MRPAWHPGAVETISELERAAAAHWRGTEEEWLGGWLLRAAGGVTGRAHSALPLRHPRPPPGRAPPRGGGAPPPPPPPADDRGSRAADGRPARARRTKRTGRTVRP